LRVIITGGTGFVGSHLAESLVNKKNDLLLISKSDTKKDNISNIQNKIIHKKVNITDFKKIGRIIDDFKPDIIIHLAGQTSHSKSFEKPLNDVDSNAKSTLFYWKK